MILNKLSGKRRLSDGRRGIRATALPVFVILVAGSLGLLGCGGEAARLGNLDLFSQARDNLKQIDSFIMDSQTSYRFYSIPEEDRFSPNEEATVSYVTYYEANGPDGPIMKTVMDGEQAMAFDAVFSGYLDRVPDQTGPYVEYATNGVIYCLDDNTGRWVSTPGNTANYFDKLNSFLSPEGLECYMKASSSVEVIEETKDYIRYEFSLDPEKYLSDSDYRRWRREAEEMGLKGDSVDPFIERCEAFVASGKYYAVVEKEMGQVSSFGWKVDRSMFEGMDSVLVPSDSDSRIELRFDAVLSSYGEDFSLKLPE